MKVVIADIDYEGAQSVASEMTKEGSSVFATRLDVRDLSSWKQALDDAVAKAGPIQIFCNNAGVSGVLDKEIEDLTDEAWTWVRSINLDGVLNGIRTLVPHMREHGQGGHIVNTGSIASFVQFPLNGDYAATKHGVAGFTMTMREQLSPENIGVTLLCPGYVRTSIVKSRIRVGAEREEDESVSDEVQGARDFIRDSGMDPFKVGRFVFSGIEDNRANIFTHPEVHRDMVKARFDEVLGDIDWSEEVSKADEG